MSSFKLRTVREAGLFDLLAMRYYAVAPRCTIFFSLCWEQDEVLSGWTGVFFLAPLHRKSHELALTGRQPAHRL